MVDPTAYILKRFNLKTDIIEIPNVDRTDLAKLFNELDFKVGAEIGVAAGEFSETIMKANPQLEKMYGVDPHAPYRGYKDYQRQATFNDLAAVAHERLDRFSNYQFVPKLSLEAAADLEDNSLDFVYIDANHSEPFVSQDIEAWARKVRPGGIVSGHDYVRLKARGGEDSSNWAVIPAITKYAKDRDIQLFVWGLEAKIPGLKREASRSWMFVR